MQSDTSTKSCKSKSFLIDDILAGSSQESTDLTRDDTVVDKLPNSTLSTKSTQPLATTIQCPLSRPVPVYASEMVLPSSSIHRSYPVRLPKTQVLSASPFLLSDGRLALPPVAIHDTRMLCNWKAGSYYPSAYGQYGSHYPDVLRSDFKVIDWSPLPRHPNKRKGGQVRFSVEQTAALERRFDGLKYLSPEDRRRLAEELKLTDRQVKTWFQNRRAKWRRASQTSFCVNSSENRRESCSSEKNSPTPQPSSHSFTYPRDKPDS